MPKKTNKAWHNRMSSDKHYFGHDDREMRVVRYTENSGSFVGVSRPRVSFKTHSRPNREISRDVALASLDEDIPMTGSNNNTRQVIMRERNRGMSRGRNSPLPSRYFRGGLPGPRPRPFPLGDSNWYRISIPYSGKYPKEYILSTLNGYVAPEVFVPIMYKIMGRESSFFIDNQRIATALANCDRKITMTDGFKLQIRVKPGFPPCEIDDKLKERLKHALSKRYNRETNAIDLSQFHHDADLVDEYFCALFRPVMLMAVLDIVAEHIPDLEALNLDGNKLQIIERLSVLCSKFPKLRILYIGDNKIREINQIDAIKDLKLEELRLAGNPVCNKYKTRQNDYVSDVRKRFPKLLRLDGVELPRPIVFDLADEVTKAPPTQRIFTADVKAQEIASQFLQQYFLIFDSENRQPLLDAYHENACLSMTINSTNTHKMNGFYFSGNRNLFRINDNPRRCKLLKQGRLPVVSFISEMPQTKHFLDSFTMDITLATQAMMFITITGFFKEINNNKEEAIYYFNRTFIIVPEGNGYCIRNEQIHISQPTDAQLKQLRNHQSQLQQPALLVPQIPSIEPGMAEPVAIPELTEDIKQQMIVTLSQQTNMNLEWSLKCLQEVQWNYDKAFTAFQEFFKLGQIPSEAFVK